MGFNSKKPARGGLGGNVNHFFPLKVAYKLTDRQTSAYRAAWGEKGHFRMKRDLINKLIELGEDEIAVILAAVEALVALRLQSPHTHPGLSGLLNQVPPSSAGG
jgi:hypothetical protein